MRYTWIDDYLMKKPGVTKELKKEWNWIRYMIGGKAFVNICLDDKKDNQPYYITLKLEPMEGEFLRQQYADIIPGYYCNKVHWNSINPDGCVPDDLMKDMIDKSYQLILKGFSKKKQQEILLTTYCGLDCTNCDWKDSCQCGGCTATKGMPFHVVEQPCPKPCQIAVCAIEKNVSFCGACEDFPCRLLTDFSNDPEYGDNPPGARIEACRSVQALLSGK